MAQWDRAQDILGTVAVGRHDLLGDTQESGRSQPVDPAHFASVLRCRRQRAQPHLGGLDGSGRVERKDSGSAVRKWRVGLSSHSSPESRMLCLWGIWSFLVMTLQLQSY